MPHDLSILRVASAMARHAATRHETLARNVANADTPGYKAKDIAPFDAVMAMADDSSKMEHRTLEMKGAEASPNGNTVSLEQQMLLSSQTQMQHILYFKKLQTLLFYTCKLRLKREHNQNLLLFKPYQTAMCLIIILN